MPVKKELKGARARSLRSSSSAASLRRAESQPAAMFELS